MIYQGNQSTPEPPPPPARERRQIGGGVRRASGFVGGIVAALIAVALYGALVPAPRQLTQQDVSDGVARALASATPAPAVSELVYDAIQPSLVLIQTEGERGTGDAGDSLGTGVVIDQMGDILTSLHVVNGAFAINVTFADGAKSGAQIVGSEPENDIAVLRAINPPPSSSRPRSAIRTRSASAARHTSWAIRSACTAR